jgi:drug/metabolite transporter (DMT)-like permease
MDTATAEATAAPDRRRALLTAVGMPVAFVVIWSSGYLVGNIGTRAAPPEALLFWRFALATTALGAVALATRAPWPRRPAQWLHAGATGVLFNTVQFGGVYLGLHLGVSAGLAALLVSASPLLIAGLSVPLFAERLGALQVLGLGLGLAGVAAAVSTQLHGGATAGGIAAVGLGLAGFTAATLYQKRFGSALDLRTGTVVQFLAATLTTVPIALLTGGLALPLTGAAIGSTLWLGLVNSIGGFLLLFVLLRSRGGGSATSYLFLVPPVTALAAVPMLGQPVTASAFIGIALAAAGVALVTRARPAR